MKPTHTLAVVIAATLAGTGAVQAQNFPTKPIRMVIALAAGGPTDVVIRMFSSKLSDNLGQQIIIDNRPGAGGNIAGEIVSKAPADGYTLFSAANGTIAVSPNLWKTLTFNVLKDLTPVTLVGNSPLVLTIHPSLPPKSVKELIELARARPGAINFGSPGQGSSAHLSSELLKMMTGVNLTHVPYKGAGPALIGVMSGEIEMITSGVSASLPYIKQGRLRALGVTSLKPVPVLPGVPTIASTVPGYESGSWYAILAPAGTPRAIVDRLHQESVKVINTPDMQAKLIAAGVDPDPITPEQLGEKIRNETARWGKVVKAAGIKPQ